MTKKMVQKLREYGGQKLVKESKEGKDWLFGAIDFSLAVGLIDKKEFDELMEEFQLLK